MEKLILLFSFWVCLYTAHGQNNSKTSSIIEDNDIYSFIISKNDKIVEEHYYNGKTKDDLCDVQSLTKGIVSILIGIAIDKKYIKSENEPITSFFPDEYKQLTDTEKKKITIKHLLNQTSGLAWKGYLEHKAWLTSENPALYVLRKPLENKPGNVYNYNSGAVHLLSIIISKATQKSTLEFANEVLFTPLKIETIDWKTRDGYYDGSGLGLEMKPIDLQKIGKLILHNGIYDEKRIVSKEWMNKLLNEAQKWNTHWGIKNSTHAYCWYKATLNDIDINYGMGYGGQFIFIIPSKKIVITTTHNHNTPNGIEQQIDFIHTKLPLILKKHAL